MREEWGEFEEMEQEAIAARALPLTRRNLNAIVVRRQAGAISSSSSQGLPTLPPSSRVRRVFGGSSEGSDPSPPCQALLLPEPCSNPRWVNVKAVTSHLPSPLTHLFPCSSL